MPHIGNKQTLKESILRSPLIFLRPTQGLFQLFVTFALFCIGAIPLISFAMDTSWQFDRCEPTLLGTGEVSELHRDEVCR